MVDRARIKVDMAFAVEPAQGTGDVPPASLKNVVEETRWALQDRLFGEGFLPAEVTLHGDHALDVTTATVDGKPEVKVDLQFVVERDEGASPLDAATVGKAVAATTDAIRKRLFGAGFLPDDVAMADSGRLEVAHHDESDVPTP